MSDNMTSKFWPVGTKLKARRNIVATKPPVKISGVVDKDGKPLPIDGRYNITAGAIFRVIGDKQPLHLSRIPLSSDAGKVEFVVEMADPADWEPC